jgi:hypothetical protein
MNAEVDDEAIVTSQSERVTCRSKAVQERQGV